MSQTTGRRTDRVTVRIPVEVGGSDPTGIMFFDRTETSAISKFGAALVLNRKLLPEQELILRHLQNGRETEVAVVGLAGQNENGWIYGVKFVRAKPNFWGIEFPCAEGDRDAALRVVLECTECHARELAYLNELEAEVFCHSAELRWPCVRCRATTRWRQSGNELTPTPAESVAVSAPAEATYASARETLVCAFDSESARPQTPKLPPPPPRTANERKHVRSKMHIQICVRRTREDREEWGRSEEICQTEDCSRGGFSFCTYSVFQTGVSIEVAIPFREGGANIFVPARIVNVRKKDDGQCRYGVAYIR